MSASAPVRIYRALLHLFPSDFRREFGPGMEQLLVDRLREAQAAGENPLRLWTACAADVVVQAAREWASRAGSLIEEIRVEGTMMEGWSRDVRFGARSLARRPGFTVAAIATLSLGIGATVSIFTVVNGVLLTPLDFPEPDRLVTVWNVDAVDGTRTRGVDHPDVRAWQEQVPGFQVAGISGTRPTLVGLGRPEVLTGARVTDGLVTLLGYTPLMGRDLVADDDDPGRPRVAVVSHGFWVERLGADDDVLGRTIQLSGTTWEIVGVAPEGFDYPEGAELWMPRRHDPDGCGHGCRIMQAVGRLAPNASLEEVQANLDAVSLRMAEEFPDSHRDVRTQIEPMLDTEVADIRTGLWVLFGAVAMVLMIACANVANLMLVRAGQRKEEMALRVSLGASRARLVRQLLTESFLLAAVAGLLGLGLSAWGTSVLVSMAPADLPRLDQAGLDPTVVGFAALLVFGVTSAFGAVPALQLSRRNLRGELSIGGRARSRRSSISRSVLVAAEVGLSLALLLGAGLLFRTLGEIRSVEYGFVTEGSERFRLSIPESRYDSLAITRFTDLLEERIRDVPGLAAVGTGFGVPLASGSINASLSLLDRPEVDPADKPSADIRPSSPGFLAASGTPLLAGRWFTAADRYDAEPVAVVNETFARIHYPEVDPIGRRLQADVSWSFEKTAPRTIVGVVADVRDGSATLSPDPAIYLPNAQFGANSLYVWLRLEPGIPTVLPAVRDVLQELDPELAITNITRVEEVIAAEQHTPRFFLTLLAAFSGLALVLASIGLYGVVAYAVSRRTREIGIRMALGAESEQVVRMVVQQGARPVLAGVLFGLALSFVGGRVLESLLYGVEPNDPLTIGTASVVMLAVAAAATLLPAWRAARIPAATALRTE